MIATLLLLLTAWGQEGAESPAAPEDAVSEAGAQAGAAPGESPSPSPELPELDEAFLSLPTVDVLPSPAPSPAAKVGDQIALSAIDPPPGAARMEWVGGSEDFAFVEPDRVALLKAGSLTLPSLAIVSAEGQRLARTNPFTIRVESAIREDDPSPREPSPPRPPVALPFPYWIVVLALAFLALLAYGGYRAWKSRKRKLAALATAQAPPEPERPFDLVALEKLAKLEGAIAKGEYKQFYFGVSETTKFYLARRYRFDAEEKTAIEIVEELERRALGRETVDRIGALFQALDRVKFTDYLPEIAEYRVVLAEARALIESTRPRAEPILRQEATNAPR